MSDTVSDFHAFCVSIGITPRNIIADGKIHRFSPAEDNRRKSSKPGWYLLYDDDYPTGVVCDWRDGQNRHVWKSDRVIGRLNKPDLREVMAQREAQRQREREAGISAARARWDAAERLNGHGHPYLSRKGVAAPVARLEGDKLLLPGYGPDRQVQTVQAIMVDGSKRFHSGAPASGAFLPLGPGLSRTKPGDPVIVCEGYATAASLQEATGYPVICTFDSGNMPKVARWLTATYPERGYIVAADDDRFTDGNPGLKAAAETAGILNGTIAQPVFPAESKGTDFNDMAAEYGVEAVAALIIDGEVPSHSAAPTDDFAPTEWTPVDPATIPPREWLFGDILARSFVSVLVAPPGVGKSIFTIEVAVSLAMKHDLGPFKAHEQAKVWLFNNEDPRLELDRRISAFLLANEIDPKDVAPNLYVDTGEERHLLVAKYDEDRNVMRMPVVDRMISHINRNKIGLLIVDPFIETHGVNENDNGAISTVARMYREIAQKTGCAVWLVHHTRKTPAGAQASAPGDADAGRGASALGGVARFTATLFNMAKEDAKELNIPEDERHLYIRFDDGKANLKLKTGEGIWWRKKSVSLGNARGFRPADSMGVLEWADMTDAKSAADEKRRQAWTVVGNSLLAQMNDGEDITLNKASDLVEIAARSVGLESKRTVERLITDSLSRPQIMGAWSLSYINEKRGNGSNWVRKERARAWQN